MAMPKPNTNWGQQFMPASLRRKPAAAPASSNNKASQLQKIKEMEAKIKNAVEKEQEAGTLLSKIKNVEKDTTEPGTSKDDEYDPGAPNEYEELCRERAAKLKEDAQKRRQEEEERRKKLRQERREAEERARYEQHARAAPNIGEHTTADKGPNQPFAQKMMKEWGWKQGQGLGANNQGVAAALEHQKTGLRTANIVMQDAPPTEAPPPPPAKKIKIKGRPTRVIMLRNMVGPGEVDADLQPEIEEECTKYGEVERVAIYEVQGAKDPTKAVRIFAKFVRQESAMKALVDLNGRFFGGRHVQGAFFSEEKFDQAQLAPENGED